jgi:TolB-like protein
MSVDSPLSGDATQSNVPLEAGRPPLSKDVFVSYASQDAAVANSVVEALERQGIRCWIAPRDVTPGEFYADAIVHAIDAAQALVLVLSQHAAVSHHILREVERASSKRYPVISLRIDRAALPAGLEYFLNTSQWLDASEEEPSRVFPKLVEAVRKVLGGAATESGGNAGQSPPLLEPRRGPRSVRRPLAVVVGLIVAAVFGFAIDKWWLSSHITKEKPVAAAVAPAAPVSAPAIPEKSVAVLPFVDMSEKHDQEYFADGLAEELLDRLARIPGLQVPARTSSFYFQGRSIPISQIARDLGVAYVVEGSVRKDRNIVRITAQLIRADTGNHVWSVTYEHPMQDVFKTQQTIAIAIADALKVTVDNRVDYGGHQTTSPEAFDQYLQAVDQTHKVDSVDDFRFRLEKAKRAVALDPSFSDGWSAVADLSISLAFSSGDKTGQLARQASNALDRATKAGNPSAKVLLRAGTAHLTFDSNAREAMSAYQRANALNPDGVQGLAAKIFASFMQGDTAQALVAARRANELDPYAHATNSNLTQAFAFDGQWASALVAAKRDLELYPESESTLADMAFIMIQNGDPNAALETVNKIEQSPDVRAALLPFVYDALNRKMDADAALADVIKRYADREPYSVALFYAHRHDADQAFAWLDRAYSAHDWVWYIRSDPYVEPLRSDARFAQLIKKWGLIN